MECRIHIPQSLPINKSLTIFSVNSGYTLLYCLHVAYSRRECGFSAPARTRSPTTGHGSGGLAASASSPWAGYDRGLGARVQVVTLGTQLPLQPARFEHLLKNLTPRDLPFSFKP